MSTSSVPAVLAALVTKVGVIVDDVACGKPLNGLPADYGVVGWAGEGAAGVVMDQSMLDVALSRNLEAYDVGGQFVSRRGGTDEQIDAVTTVYANLDALDTAVRLDSRLGGVCMLAQLSASELEIDQTGDGPVVTLTYTFHIQAAK